MLDYQQFDESQWDAGKLCQVYATPGGALTIARELGGKGFAFCLRNGAHLSSEEPQDCHEAMRAEKLVE